jgi:nitroreductase
MDGGSIYPAVENLFLAARALGYGGVMSVWHQFAEAELTEILELPPTARFVATIPMGRPVGGHGPVRRAPLGQVVFEDRWGQSPEWAVDPEGTRFSGGPGSRHPKW